MPAGKPICEYCGTRQATHFCSGCGHWVCSWPTCMARASAAAIKRGVNHGRRP